MDSYNRAILARKVAALDSNPESVLLMLGDVSLHGTVQSSDRKYPNSAPSFVCESSDC